MVSKQEEENSQLGEEHVTSRGNIKDARNLIKIGGHQKCRFKCYGHIPEADRQEICHNYWSKGDWIRQKAFILHHVKIVEVARGNENAMQNRKESRQLYLQNGEYLYRTCKDFFSKTLCISNTVIDNALSKRSSKTENLLVKMVVDVNRLVIKQVIKRYLQ